MLDRWLALSRLPAVRIACSAYAVLAAVVLALGTAVDASFFAHFERRYQYTTSIDLGDVIRVARAFRPQDLGGGGWQPFFLVAAALTLTMVVIPRSPWWGRLAAAIPQLPLLVLFPIGIVGFISDLHFRRDGEWFHEGWPFMEAVAVWLPVPFFVTAATIASLIDRLRTSRSDSRAKSSSSSQSHRRLRPEV